MNDIKEVFMLFFLLYADDIMIFAEFENSLQKGLDIVYEYCQQSKLTANTSVHIMEK